MPSLIACTTIQLLHETVPELIKNIYSTNYDNLVYFVLMHFVQQNAVTGRLSLDHSLSVTPSTALQCYTCQKTVKTVNRFTKEETETLQCTEDPADWTVETCLDQREFCSKGKGVISYSSVKYDRGCAIPKGKYCIDKPAKSLF